MYSTYIDICVNKVFLSTVYWNKSFLSAESDSKILQVFLSF